MDHQSTEGFALHAGFVHVVDADLKSDFDTIPHDRLLAAVAEKVSDRRVLVLVQMFLKPGILDGLSEWTPDEGSPPVRLGGRGD